MRRPGYGSRPSSSRSARGRRNCRRSAPKLGLIRNQASRSRIGPVVQDFSEDGALTQSDPTDEALATIASILETPTTGSPPIAPSEAAGYTKMGPRAVAYV